MFDILKMRKVMTFKLSPLNDCNWTQTQNHWVHIWTLTHLATLAKWLSFFVSTYLYGAFECTDKYSEHSSIIWPLWPNGWVFIYELSGSGFESSCNHLNFRFCACIEHRVRWHSDNYRVWIHFETCTWHDKNIQSVCQSIIK